MQKTGFGPFDGYFLYGLPIVKDLWLTMDIPDLYKKSKSSKKFFSHLSIKAYQLDNLKEKRLTAGDFYIFSMLNRVFRYLIAHYTERQNPYLWDDLFRKTTSHKNIFKTFISLFPGTPYLSTNQDEKTIVKNLLGEKGALKLLIRDMLILYLAHINPATDRLKPLFDDPTFFQQSDFERFIKNILHSFESLPPFVGSTKTIAELLLLPIKTHPHSLYEQLSFVLKNYRLFLPEEFLSEIILALDIYKEEHLERGIGPGETKVIEFREDTEHLAEPEQFTPDRGWMANVVMIAKMVYVWLYQLSKKYGKEITRLDQIPDEELDQLATWGFNALWLIGIWERSPASQKIKHLCGNYDAIASAYSLYNYEVAKDLGGLEALLNLKERAWARGIRLACDMVPNHTGLFSQWIVEHPDWFIQIDEPPYPNYSFNGEDLSPIKDISLFIEDGYYSKTDAAVVFKYVDNRTGRVRYIYHGNDGTSTPWNDTAQLNYLLPEVRKAVIDTILKIAELFPIIRFDAAMTLTKRHYQRLWFPLPGQGGSIPSRAQFSMTKEEFDKAMPKEFWREVVDVINAHSPDTLLIAEAFWLMEGYFVRTLGMHRVYNSAFMNMLKLEENAKYRKLIRNIVEFEPEILKRFVNFMNNPDEETAVAQFGKEKKYFGVGVLLSTLPGLPLFGHGQIEGFREKYGMEFKRSYWDEVVDYNFVKEHERRIFPLLKKRQLFSHSENFVFYNFYSGDAIDENVFAFSNRNGKEAALIIYHNKFGKTKGWVKTSTPFLRKSNGKSFLTTTDLGKALFFKNDDRVFYIFTDCKDRLQYIRKGKELCEKGLYLELDVYDYHVFMDFIEVINDENNTWQKVYEHLNGKGDENIFDLYKLIKHQKTIEHFFSILSKIEEAIEITLSKNQEILQETLVENYKMWEGHGLTLSRESFEATKALVHFFSKHKKTLRPYLNKEGSKFLSLTLTLNLFDLNPLVEDPFGIIPALKRKDFLPIAIEPLLRVISSPNVFFVERDKHFYKSLVKQLQDKDIEYFLGVNTYNGIRWFIKERFETLLLLYCVDMFTKKDYLSLSPKTSPFPLAKRFKKITTLAKKTNYNYDELLNLLTTI